MFSFTVCEYICEQFQFMNNWLHVLFISNSLICITCLEN